MKQYSFANAPEETKSTSSSGYRAGNTSSGTGNAPKVIRITGDEKDKKRSSYQNYLSGKAKHGSSSAWYDSAAEEEKKQKTLVEKLQNQIKYREQNDWANSIGGGLDSLSPFQDTPSENYQSIEALQKQLEQAERDLERATEELGYASEWRYYDADMAWLDNVNKSGQDWGSISDALATMTERTNATYDEALKALQQAEQQNKRIDQLRRQGGAPSELEAGYTDEAQLAEMRAQLEELDEMRGMAERRYTYSLDELAKDSSITEWGRIRAQGIAKQDEKAYSEHINELIRGAESGELGVVSGVDVYTGNTRDYRPTDSWSEDQLNRYYVILNRQDEEAAGKYAVEVNTYNNLEAQQQATEGAYNFGKARSLDGAEGFWGHVGAGLADTGRGLAGTALNVLSMPEQLFEYVDKANRVAATGAYTGNAQPGMSDYGEAISRGRAETLNERYSIGGKGAGDLYQLTNSMAQSLVYGNLAGTAGTLTLFFGTAANQGFDDAMSRGADPEQALTFGMFSGIAEAAAEFVPLNNLLNADKALTRGFLKSAMIQAGFEGLEEGATDVLNTIADQLVMGDKSTINSAITARMQQGESYEQAAKAEWGNYVKDVMWDMIGGTISGAGSSAIQYGVNMASPYQVDAEGRSLYGTSAKTLAQEAQEVQGNKELNALGKQAEDKLNKGKSISNATAQKLAKGTNRAAMLQSTEAQIKERFKDVKEEDIQYLTHGVVSVARGERPGPMMQRTMDKYRDTADTLISELDLGKANEERADWAKDIGGRGIEATKLGNKDVKDFFKSLADEKSAANTDADAVEDMSAPVTIPTKGGEITGTVSGIKTGQGMPQFIIRSEDGKDSYVNADEAINSGALPAGMARLAYQSLGLGDAAADVYRLYSPGQDVNEYVNAMDDAMSIAADVSSRTAFDKSDAAQMLSDEQRNYAWQQGQQKRDNRRESQSKAQTQRKKKSPRKRGTVSYDGAIIGGVKYKATSKDKIKAADLRVIERIAKAANVNVVFYESDSIDGMYQGANGFYSDGTVYLDVHAAASKTTQQDAILLTAAHELTHHIRMNAEAQYDALKEFIVERLLEDGQDFETLVQSKRTEKGMSRADAVEEVIADACEMVLKDSKAVEKLAKENKSLAQTIADWLHGFYEDIKAAFEGVEARSKEAKAMTDYMDELVKLWDDALIEASKGESKQRGKVKASYAGRKSETADNSLYQQALDMEKAGKDSETIRKQTGWFKGMDGQWRYEISDAEAVFDKFGEARYKENHPEYVKYQELMEKILDGSAAREEWNEIREIESKNPEFKTVRNSLRYTFEQGNATLGDVFSHSTLFAAYPEVAKTKIVFQEMEKGKAGGYNTKTDTLLINKNLLDEPKKLLSTMLHEIQHRIQIEEGFAKGASPAYWNRLEQYEQGIQKFKDSRNKLLQKMMPDEKAMYYEYRDIERQQDEMFEDLLNADLDLLEMLEARSDELYEQMYGKAWFDKLNLYDRVIENPQDAVNAMYFYTAGEIEARDAAFRRTLTAEQRKNTRPDIDREDVVFADGSFISYSYDELTDIVDSAIADKGFKNGAGRSEALGEFSPLMVSMVKSASGNAIDISNKEFAVNRGEIFHAYKRHSNEKAETSRDQIALKPADIVDAIWAVQNPDVVEALFTTVDNPTQMLSFAYAKQTADGHFVVVEAVGGKNNKNVTPVEIHKFTQNKWNKMVSRGKTMGEVLYENDPKKFAALDVAANKNNRVIAAQFVQTNPASSAFSSANNNIFQIPDKVKYSRRDSSEGLTKEEARAQAQAYTQLKAENAALKRRLDYWQGQTKRTKQRTINRGDVDKYANQLIKMHGSEVDKDWLKQKLRELGDYLVQSDELDWDVLHQMAWEISTAVIENAEVEDDSSAYDNKDDIVDDIKGYRFHLNEMYKNDLPEGFRKRYSGKLHISYTDGRSVDSIYENLQRDYGKTLFPDMPTQADMLVMIGDAYDTVTTPPAVYNPYQYHMNETITSVSYDILDMMMSEEIRQTAPTAADKAASKLDQQKAADRRKLNQVRADKNARIAEIRRQETAKRQEAVAKEKAKKYEKVAAVREYYQSMIKRQQERRRENAAAKKYRDSAYDKASTLMDWLIKNSDKEHIPEALKAPIIELLSTIDLSSRQMLKKGEATRKDETYTKKMQQLRDILSRQQAYMQKPGEADGLDVFLDLPDGFDETIKQHIDSVDAILKKNTDAWNTGPIAYMTAAQLEDLDFILTTLTTSIKQINKFITDSHYASVIEGAQDSMRFLREMGAGIDRSITKERADQFLAWTNALPIYVFKRFGAAGQERFGALINGWGKMAMNVQAAIKYAEETYSAEEVKAWEETVREINLTSGSTARMTEAQMMGLYCSYKREQARGHLLAGGMRVADIEPNGVLKKKIRQTDAFQLTNDDIINIAGMLSERQIEVADKLQSYFNTTCAQWGNEVSMARFGYRQFTESNYYPITTDQNNHPAADPKARETDIFRLLNMSATKALTPNANNSIVIFSIFDVFSAHTADMAKYNALALPILDLLKWYNYKDKQYSDVTDSMGETNTQLRVDSVQGSVERTYGKAAQNYILNFLKDLNGVREGGRNEQLLKGFLGKYKSAAVAANFRVAIQQPTSIVRASYMINPKYLTQGAAMKGGVEEAMKYSGLAVWKSMGYFDTNISRNMRQQIKHADTQIDKIREKSMKLAELGDKVTWGAIWNACKLEQQETKGLSGEELMKATNERFNEIILSTQVLDSTISRSDIMRQQSLAVSELTSFMSEPTVSYNILMDSAMQFEMTRRQTGSITEARKKNWPIMGRALAVYGATATVTAAAAAIVDAMRDDDEYQNFIEKWCEHVKDNLEQGINPINLVPIVGEIINVALGKETHESMLFQPVTQLSKAWTAGQDLIRDWFKTGKELNDPSRTNWGRLYQMAQAVSSLSGLPVAGFMREFKTVWNMSIKYVTGKTLKTYDSGVKNNIKYGVLDGYISEEEAVALLVDSGEYSDPDDAYWQVQEWVHADDSEWTRYNDVFSAVLADDMEAFALAQDMLGDHGVPAKSVRTTVKSQIGHWFIGGEGMPVKMDEATALKALQQYAGLLKIEAQHLLDEWKFEKKEGVRWADLKDAYVSGKYTAEQVKTFLTTYGHEYSKDAGEKVMEWTCEKETGIAFNNLCDAFIHKEITEGFTVDCLVKYGGENRADAEMKVAQWGLAEEYGIRFGSTDAGIKKALIEGYISDETAKAIMVAFDNKTWEEAEDYVNQYHFTEETGYNFSEIEEAFADGVIDYDEMVDWYTKASIYSHGSVEVATEYAEVAVWKKEVPGAERMNRDGLEKWTDYGEKYLGRVGLGREDFAAAWKLYSTSYSEYDIYGNKAKEKAEVFFERLYKLYQEKLYSLDEVKAMAKSIYSTKYINKYAPW